MTAKEAEQLIQDLFDRQISERDFVLLEEELSLNQESRELYRDYAFLHSELSGMIHPHPVLSRDDLTKRLLKVLTSESSEANSLSRRKTIRFSLACTAVISALLALTLYFTGISDRPQIASLSFAPDSHFAISHLSTEQPESPFPVGSTIELSQGTLQLDLENGVRAIVSAPANFTRSADHKLNLHAGTAWFRVPEEGHGFQVQTSGLLITDLGTEFGVIHVPGSTDEVHVLKGKVRVSSLTGMKSEEELSAGQARLVNIRGELAPPPELSAPFTKTLPDRLPYLHLSFDQVKTSTTPVHGKHPAQKNFTARLIQSDNRHSADRLTDGRFGKALSFDGKGDFVKTNWPGLYGSQPMTVAFWLRPRGNPNFAGIVSWGTGKLLDENSNQWKLVVTPRGHSPHGSLFRCAWGHDKFFNVPVEAPEEEWIHLAMVYSGGSSSQQPFIKFYLNGVESPSSHAGIPDPPRRPSDLSTARMLAFGHPLDWPEGTPNFNGNFLRGDLDEVFIIEGALTQKQISRIYRENTYSP